MHNNIRTKIISSMIIAGWLISLSTSFAETDIKEELEDLASIHI